MATSISSLPSLTLFLLAILSPLLPASSTSRGSFSPHHLSPQTPFRVGLTHVDADKNYTKLEILRRAIYRSKRRLNKLSLMTARNIATPESDDIEAPIHSGDGEFLMNITIGTPPVPFTAIMDTGSDLIWTQCNPCINCFHQDTPLFDPKKSSTCSNVSCSSELCKDTNVFKCNNNECNFVYTYGDESSTQGFMAKETLTFVDSNKNPVSIPNVGFGCGVNNQEQGLVQSSGLVGLG